jgi:tRNA pseudouridine55 synthase
LSSNAALQRAKRCFNAEKAGHTGTLDPLASGLLPLCFGEATKFAQFLLEATKRYTATVRFGITTATGDAEGDVLVTHAVELVRDDVEAALPAFTGRLAQTPPAHSALKFKGRNYYEYARAGVAVERTPREIEILKLSLLDWQSPDAVIDVTCSKGTYVRVLAEDIGQALGCGAHLAGLRRTATGGFAIDGAVTLDVLEAIADPAQRDALLLPVDAPLSGMSRLDVDADSALALIQGRSVSESTRTPGRYRCYAPRRFLGIVEVVGNVIRPLRMVPQA